MFTLDKLEFVGRRGAVVASQFGTERQSCFGLATDMIAACRGERSPDLPDLLHARNLRATIAAALEASATRHATKILWRHTTA